MASAIEVNLSGANLREATSLRDASRMCCNLSIKPFSTEIPDR
jgi:hypothetical protein